MRRKTNQGMLAEEIGEREALPDRRLVTMRASRRARAEGEVPPNGAVEEPWGRPGGETGHPVAVSTPIGPLGRAALEVSPRCSRLRRPMGSLS